MNFYAYCLDNPINCNDPSGNFAETPWDLLNVGLGSYSFTTNIRTGNWGWAAADAIGLIYDVGATAVPFLPAGASAGMQALRQGNNILDSVNIGFDVAKTANIANDVAQAASTTARAATEGSKIHYQVGKALDEGDLLSDSANNFFRGANGATGKQPDLSWTGSGLWADLTTPGQWASHVNKYSANFGEGIPLLYERGVGLVNTNPLTSFMGSFLTGSQMLFGGSQSANGGFVLYPSKANTNMMKAVYSK
ncbi:hypothetical protein AADEFJLK_02947 [Methylovulum psychrotolerans]|uniref:RHS repeat-associated core domain-containing protein n=1 Tax=Methylovulum psychrotolerans TaxID=1704499 RepID=A0A2S5CJK2_9GAMM|nr:hypothetical protein AADEFJLK_02947 [Methylovulum psychrotolerans]